MELVVVDGIAEIKILARRALSSREKHALGARVGAAGGHQCGALAPHRIVGRLHFAKPLHLPYYISFQKYC